MQQKLQKLKTNLLFFLELQLLISLVTCPILIGWGLPISIMSILGNLIFAQFLTLFIFVSAILFTTDIFGIPNYLIRQVLESITNTWYFFLSFGSAYWLIGFPIWIFPISLLLAIAGCSLYYKNNIHQTYRIIILFLLCISIPLVHKFFSNQSLHISVEQGLQKIHVINIRGKIYAFDCGALGARISSQSWIDYTFIPTLIKTMGATHIDILVLCKSNSRTKEAARQLKQSIPTKRSIEILRKN